MTIERIYPKGRTMDNWAPNVRAPEKPRVREREEDQTREDSFAASQQNYQDAQTEGESLEEDAIVVLKEQYNVTWITQKEQGALFENLCAMGILAARDEPLLYQSAAIMPTRYHGVAAPGEYAPEARDDAWHYNLLDILRRRVQSETAFRRARGGLPPQMEEILLSHSRVLHVLLQLV